MTLAEAPTQANQREQQIEPKACLLTCCSSTMLPSRTASCSFSRACSPRNVISSIYRNTSTIKYRCRPLNPGAIAVIQVPSLAKPCSHLVSFQLVLRALGQRARLALSPADLSLQRRVFILHAGQALGDLVIVAVLTKRNLLLQLKNSRRVSVKMVQNHAQVGDAVRVPLHAQRSASDTTSHPNTPLHAMADRFYFGVGLLQLAVQLSGSLLADLVMAAGRLLPKLRIAQFCLPTTIRNHHLTRPCGLEQPEPYHFSCIVPSSCSIKAMCRCSWAFSVVEACLRAWPWRQAQVISTCIAITHRAPVLGRSPADLLVSRQALAGLCASRCHSCKPTSMVRARLGQCTSWSVQ